MIYFVLLLAITCIPVNATVYAGTKEHRNWSKLPTENCGKMKLATRIVGGNVASLGQFPWMARLAYTSLSRKTIQIFCAGSLISETFVVTAAHCVTNRLRRRLRFIRVGENHADTDVDCDEYGACAPIHQDIQVKNIILHSEFNFITFKNDIALISLANKAKLNAFVLPICLPQPAVLGNFTLTGQVKVAGWGETNPWTSTYPSKLRYVALPVQSNEKCNRISTRPLDSSQYCVGEGNEKDSCGGDSGGPMMKAIAFNFPRRYFLFGVVSQGGVACGEDPAIYTSVPYYMEWILDHLGYD